jgi:NhaA family Na+:H+ antiporter
MSRIARFAVDHYLVVPFGSALAMAWANTSSESYFRFSHSWSFAVNDLGMPLFFAFVTQEILEAMMPGGALATWRRGMLPIIAAMGGLFGSVLIYLGYLQYVDEIMLFQAWPCAAAVDVVFSYFVARMIFRDRASVAFTLLLAVATDVVVLIVVAVRYPSAQVHPTGPLLIVLALSLALLFRWAGTRAFWPYLVVCGPVCWWGFVWSGLQPALALMPIVPFVPRSPRSLELFADTGKGIHGSASHVERVLVYPVQVVLFFFALVNSGVVLTYFEPGTWALPLAALVGRPIGVMAAVSLAVAGGLTMPLRGGWRELLVVGFIVSTGFSFALFVATGIFPIGDLLTQMKMGALSTILGLVLAMVSASSLRVGRFTSTTRPGKHLAGR